MENRQAAAAGSAPDARRFIRREELCPNLWRILEDTVDNGGLNLVDLKIHLLLCDTCQAQIFESAERFADSGKLPGGTAFMFSSLIKKARRILEEQKADALRLLRTRDGAAISELLNPDREG